MRVDVLVSGNSELLRLLGSRACARLGLERHIAMSGEEALEMARRMRPPLMILDAEMLQIEGTEVCRRIKAEALGGRVMLATRGVLSRERIERLMQVGCDDVLVLPTVANELFAHVADLLRLPRRQSRRVDIELLARLESGPRVWQAQLQDLSLSGARMVLEEPLGDASEVRVRLTTEQRDPVVLTARVVWRQKDGLAAGLKFTDLSASARRQLESLVQWDVAFEDGLQRVYLEGDFGQATDFTALVPHLQGRVDFDAAGVRYINSVGAHLWINFIDQLSDVIDYTFSRCSIAFTTQASVIPSFVGRGRVVSFTAPYHCGACDLESLRLLQTSALVRDGVTVVVPRFRCLECSAELILDELPERYLTFLDRKHAE